MPLSPPAARRHLHTREIELRGYGREDGLIDIEAHLRDTKPVPERRSDGSTRQAGEPVHDMWIRMTIDTDRKIDSVEASMDSTPFAVCPGAAPNFARLAGLRIEAGFLKQAMERVGGGEGCTHLRELLQQLGTVAFQTLYSIGKMSDEPRDIGARRPPLLNSCYAWDESRDMVATRHPAWHRPRVSAAAD